MKTKKTYFKPAIQVVEMTISTVLLLGSPTSATQGGYQYQENSEGKGWEDSRDESENNKESLRNAGDAGIHRMFKR